jgi:hypothetical protein
LMHQEMAGFRAPTTHKRPPGIKLLHCKDRPADPAKRDHRTIHATPCRRPSRITEPTTCARVYSFRSCLCPCKARPGARSRSFSSLGEAALRHRPIRATPCRLPSRQSTGYSLAVHRAAGRRFWNHPPLASFILRVMLVSVSAHDSAAWAPASHTLPDEAGAS